MLPQRKFHFTFERINSVLAYANPSVQPSTCGLKYAVSGQALMHVADESDVFCSGLLR